MTTSPTPVRVLVVADDPLARAGLATLLAAQPGCAVVGQTESATGLGDALSVFRPDVVVWDLGWDADRMLERLADLRDLDVPVVALAPDEAAASRAWASGARGILMRNASAEALAASLAAVARGVAVLDPGLASALITPVPSLGANEASGLTPREGDVLRLLAEGLPNKAIAQRLTITEHTVKFHVNAILGKLGAQSRTEAVVLATRRGLIPL